MKNTFKIEGVIDTLKQANLNNKSNMIAIIVNSIAILEDFVMDNQSKDEAFEETIKDDGVRYENTYDDESPDYIKMSTKED